MHGEQFELHADIELRHWWFVGRRRIMARIVAEVLRPSKDSLIVDVGCGTGANIAALAERYDCLGIDTSAEAVAWAQKRFPGVRFMTGYAPDDLGPLMQQARLVMLMDVLEHVEDDFSAFSRLLAAAAPGTYFLVTVPADDSLWSEHDESFGHYRRYDRARFERLWAGLAVHTPLLSYFNARLLPIVQWVRHRNRRRGHASGRAGTDFWLPARPVNAMLAAIFAGESGRMLKMLRGRRSEGYPAGTSLIALLRRESGDITVRQKPADVAPDRGKPG